MATNYGRQTAPEKIDPQELMDQSDQSRGGRWSIVIRSPDDQGAIVGKYHTSAPFTVPDGVGDFVVIAVPDVAKMSDGTYAYDESAGYQSESD